VSGDPEVNGDPEVSGEPEVRGNCVNASPLETRTFDEPAVET